MAFAISLFWSGCQPRVLFVNVLFRKNLREIDGRAFLWLRVKVMRNLASFSNTYLNCAAESDVALVTSIFSFLGRVQFCQSSSREFWINGVLLRLRELHVYT